MSSLNKKLAATVALVVVVGLGIWLAFFLGDKEPEVESPIEVVDTEPDYPIVENIGQSVLGRDIESYTWGDGNDHLVFVGGIHGGYEWNSVVLAYEFIDWMNQNQGDVPENIKVTVIPSANPDGVFEVVGKIGKISASDVPADADTVFGRFNARGVDLNRNFDCKWQPESTWRGETVSAGSAPFSEPEAVAIRNFALENRPDVFVFWHSKANNVYASECLEGVLPETVEVMNAYSQAAGYGAVELFDAYEVTGDAEGWLASIGIPAVTVELETHESVEWERNLAGVKALFNHFE